MSRQREKRVWETECNEKDEEGLKEWIKLGINTLHTHTQITKIKKTSH